MKFFVIILLAIAVTSGIPIGENEKICEPGVTTRDDCNDCVCSRDGTSKACTMMLCPSYKPKEVRKRRDTIEKICKPGETRMNDCNSCFCLGDGTGWGCTEMGCPSKVCEPGKRYRRYCNECACGNDGTSEICTRKECPKNMYNEDGSLINETIEVSQNSLLRQKRSISTYVNTCKPGTTFKEYCNTCHCGSDGSTASCTMMFCSRDIYNKDGSMKIIGQSL